jgi:hypothetical protein
MWHKGFDDLIERTIPVQAMRRRQHNHTMSNATWFAFASSACSGTLVAVVVRATKIDPGKPVVLLGVTNP